MNTPTQGHTMTPKQEAAMRQALGVLRQCLDHPDADDAITALREALAQQAAEPVAWLFQNEETGLTECVDTQQVEWGFEKNNPRWQKIAPLYTHPAPAQQPLTDEQINDIARRIGAINTGVSLGASVMRLIRAIEAAHGITGSKT